MTRCREQVSITQYGPNKCHNTGKQAREHYDPRQEENIEIHQLLFTFFIYLFIYCFYFTFMATQKSIYF